MKNAQIYRNIVIEKVLKDFVNCYLYVVILSCPGCLFSQHETPSKLKMSLAYRRSYLEVQRRGKHKPVNLIGVGGGGSGGAAAPPNIWAYGNFRARGAFFRALMKCPKVAILPKSYDIIFGCCFIRLNILMTYVSVFDILLSIKIIYIYNSMI